MHTAAKTEKGAGLDLKSGLFHGRPIYWIASLLLLAVLVLSLLCPVRILRKAKETRVKLSLPWQSNETSFCVCANR